jgi:hypothetical protein
MKNVTSRFARITTAALAAGLARATLVVSAVALVALVIVGVALAAFAVLGVTQM